MNPSKLRWGVLGAAEIARKNVQAIRLSGNAVLTGVASRDEQRCHQFIADCQAAGAIESTPKAFRTYDELLASPEIDAVYIPLPTSQRKPWVLRAAQAGKHVICEKPCATTVDDLKEMIEACRQHRVQFMDGVMFVHSQRLPRMREILRDQQRVGDIRRISSAFSFRGGPEFFETNIRVHGGLEPHGCLGDLGWYCIRFTLWAMDWRMPQQVSGRILAERSRPDSPNPVPVEFSAELYYEQGVSSSFQCSFITELQQWAVIGGTEGYLRISDYVLPFAGDSLTFDVFNSTYHIQGCDFSMKSGERRYSVGEHSHGHPNAQESNLFRNFSAAALSGQLDETWPKAALQTQIIMEACLASARANSRLVDLPV